MYPGKGTVVLIRPAQTFYERINFAFNHLEAERVYASVFVDNIASRRVLEKTGYRLDGTLRSNVLKLNEWRDEWFFTILRSEWEPHKEWYRPEQEQVVLI